MKKVRLFHWMIAFTSIWTLTTAAFAQLPPAAKLIPSGFKLVNERNLGGSIFISAKKNNENFPKPHMDQGIDLEITWMQQPMPDQVLDLVAKQPEDPGGRSPGSATSDEPCGKTSYRGGILVCRKVSTPWIGSGKGPVLVTWRIGWTGKGPGGLVGVSVNQFYGSKETAIGWVDEIIPKIAKPQ